MTNDIEPWIERLDRGNPPPGWAWYDERCDYVVDIGTGRPGLLTVNTAWDRYEARENPPGLDLVWAPDDLHTPLGAGEWRVCFGSDVLWRRHFADQNDVDGMAPSDLARAAAWACYWRRVKVAEAVDREDIRRVMERDGDACPLPGTHPWPRCLAWPDEQVSAVERWLADGGEVPEVLRNA